VEGRRGGALLTALLVQGEGRRLDPQRSGDHIDALFRAACAMSGSRQVAEDLVQETYVKVLARPRLLRKDDDLGYLIKALRNTWYSYLRTERGRRAASIPGGESPEDLELPATRANPETSLEASTVLDAVSRLPVQFREVVTAVDVAGLSYAEAARALGIRQGTVMSRLYRGREQVALALGSG
jgi:RNA polymerase sigma-70 factor (ECF subfamily)